jgi:outer membrane protein OmpA-like peptidoglycan-associated protein
VADRAVDPAGRDAASASTRDAPDEDLQSLRSILIGPAERQLHDLQARLDDRFAHAREVGAVLPQALLSRARDPELARALTPSVEQAITASVRRDPKPLADAIFPVIGPAIRKAVAASLAAMVESLNRTLEHSVSWRALRWRFEALRTGKPFGEIVLLHTLLYRVEQVFLIHRKTGLLLQHVRAGPAEVEDAQLVSAMLTAIRDFVQDSFRVMEHDSLDALQVGELSVWIEEGPTAILAMVVRGNAPREQREVLQRTLEAIHLQYAESLEAFDGDTQSFASSRPVLEECLHSEYRAEKKSRARRAAFAAGLVLLALGIWLAFSLRAHVRWTGYLEALRNEPGLVVISSERRGGRYVVTGLRDSLARDPGVLLQQSRMAPEDVVSQWEPYQALTPSFVQARARNVLKPPAGVTLTLQGGVLTAAGEATAEWIVGARQIAPLIAGVSGFDAERLLASGIQSRTRRIEGANPLFARGTTSLLAGQDDKLRALAEDIHELEALGAAAGRTFRIDVVGNTDADGPAVSNLPLSRARAAEVLRILDLRPSRHLEIRATGVGSAEPRATGEAEGDKQRNRRVSFRVAQNSAAAPGRLQ